MVSDVSKESVVFILKGSRSLVVCLLFMDLGPLKMKATDSFETSGKPSDVALLSVRPESSIKPLWKKTLKIRVIKHVIPIWRTYEPMR